VTASEQQVPRLRRSFASDRSCSARDDNHGEKVKVPGVRRIFDKTRSSPSHHVGDLDFEVLFELRKRGDSRQASVAIGAGNVEEHSLHSGAGGAQIVDGVDIADVEAFLRSCAEFVEGCLKNHRVGFLTANDPGVGDAEKALGDAASVEQFGNFPVGVGDYADAKFLADTFESRAGARRHVVPVGGSAGGGDQRVANRIIFDPKLIGEVGVEHPPEAVVGATVVLEDVVKFVLGFAFEGLPLVVGGDGAAFVQRSKDALAVGEEQSIAYIEEDGFGMIGHRDYLPTDATGEARSWIKIYSTDHTTVTNVRRFSVVEAQGQLEFLLPWYLSCLSRAEILGPESSLWSANVVQSRSLQERPCLLD